MLDIPLSAIQFIEGFTADKQSCQTVGNLTPTLATRVFLKNKNKKLSQYTVSTVKVFQKKSSSLHKI